MLEGIVLGQFSGLTTLQHENEFRIFKIEGLKIPKLSFEFFGGLHLGCNFFQPTAVADELTQCVCFMFRSENDYFFKVTVICV